MAETATVSPTGDAGPSTAAFLADPAEPPGRPETPGKRPYRDETEEAAFDVTNPQHREDCLITISEADANQRLADFERKIGEESPKTSLPQRKLAARGNLIDYYRDLANEQTEYGWKVDQGSRYPTNSRICYDDAARSTPAATVACDNDGPNVGYGSHFIRQYHH